MLHRIVLRSPEITLKGRNQRDFHRALLANVRLRLRPMGLRWRLGSARGRTYLDLRGAASERVEAVLAALRRTPGVDSVSPGLFLSSQESGQHGDGLARETIEQTLLQLAEPLASPERTFALRIHRLDKTVPLSSEEMARWLGAMLLERTAWRGVDLDAPDQALYIDVYPDGFFFSAQRLPALGGLPVGTAGRVLCLLSGGIDSPVAAYLMAKRGCSVDFVHMLPAHPDNVAIEETVVGRLARLLSEATLTSRLWVVPYGPFDLSLPGRSTGHEVVLFRRFLTRVAQRLAGEIGAQALVTGDSLAQVASQTLANLVSTSRAVEMPILRPLLGFNKQEIIALGRRIGSYEISIQPHPDCCALIGGKPRTSSRHRSLSGLEASRLENYRELVEETLQQSVCLGFEAGRFLGQSAGWQAMTQAAAG